MKAKRYTLTSPLEQQQLERAIELLDPSTVDSDKRSEAFLHAGIDRYVGGIGFFRLTSGWNGHAKDALVVRHINSSGVQVTVCEVDAAPPPSELAPSQPAPVETAVEPAPAPANDNKEAPAAPASNA